RGPSLHVAVGEAGSRLVTADAVSIRGLDDSRWACFDDRYFEGSGCRHAVDVLEVRGGGKPIRPKRES
ncbi:MAG: hypothetical protein ACRYG8_51665, partial [Janthinobacterium lividum]